MKSTSRAVVAALALMLALAACAGPAEPGTDGSASEVDASVAELQEQLTDVRRPDMRTLDAMAQETVSACLAEEGLPEGTVIPRGWFGAGPDLERPGLRTDGTIQPSSSLGYGHVAQLDEIVWSSWLVDGQGQWLAEPGDPRPPSDLPAEQRSAWGAAMEQCSVLGHGTLRTLGRDGPEQVLAAEIEVLLERIQAQGEYRQAIQRWHGCLPSDVQELGETPEQLEQYFAEQQTDLVNTATSLAEVELEKMSWVSQLSPTDFITVDAWREHMPEIDEVADAELRASAADDLCWRTHVEVVVDELWRRLA
jgi:hypothetical protein